MFALWLGSRPGRLMLDRDTVQALRSHSRVALDAFVDQANKTRSFFDGIEDVSEVCMSQFVHMLKQRQIENDALERYQRARLALFKVAKRSGIMAVPRGPVSSALKDGDGRNSVHVLLFQCPKCDSPIVASTLSEYLSLEMVEGMGFNLECKCSWLGQQLGASANKHLVEAWAASREPL